MIRRQGRSVSQSSFDNKSGVSSFNHSEAPSVLLTHSYPPYLASFEIKQFLRNEIECLNCLDGEGAPKIYPQTENQKALTLITQTQIPLEQHNYLQVLPDQLIRIALSLALSLSKIHNRNWLHLSIQPSAIRLSEDLDYAEFLDFSAARPLSKETSGINNFRPPLADPHYLAPEQGYQLTRSLDTRTDLYALGAVYYWMLHGSPPFAELQKDEEISYAHIAVEPAKLSVSHCDGTVSPLEQALLGVIKKLMAKEPANRYQSATALVHDLRLLLKAPKTDLSDFKPGLRNTPDRLYIPNKLYGRDKETRVLMEAFHRVEQGPSEAILISGYSGVGKSALAYEVQTPILRANGLFVWGKFEQYQGASPYSAIAQAFRHFVRNIMSLPPEQIGSWKDRLNKALFPNAQILIELIPELGQLLGPQPTPSVLGPDEQQNRFNNLFLNFVHTICTEHKPLVLFIDDLQWADLASINLLKVLFSDSSSKYCLVLGAYRDNEVDSRHPFIQMLAALEDDSQRVGEISLQPLNTKCVNQLISDCLLLKESETKELAELVSLKTHGNPFFMRQFLHELYQSDLLTFEQSKQRWNWSFGEIKRCDITDNVVELMIKKINRLPLKSQTLLKQASCMGTIFKSTLLNSLQQESERFDDNLKPILNARLLNQEGTSLRFLHDRVQQAAYSLLSVNERTQLHFDIGCLLLNQLEANKWREHSYELLVHLNQAHSKLSKEQRYVVAEINLAAAERARSATAYSLAVKYVQNYFQLISDRTRSSSNKPYLLYLECLYLSGEYDKAESQKQEVAQRCISEHDFVQLKTILITQYTRYGFLNQAINEGLVGLEKLGNPLPENPDMEEIGRRVSDIKSQLKIISFREIASQEAIKDERIIHILELLMAMQPCCYNSGSLLFPVTILELLRLTISEGNSTHSSYVLMMYALLSTKVLKEYDTAFDAELYSAIAGKRFKATPLVEGRLQMMKANFVLPWQKTLAESSTERTQAYHACLEQGDYYWGVHTYIFGFYADLFCAEKLDPLLKRTEDVTATCKKIKQPAQVYLSQLQTNLIKILQGSLDNQHNLDHKPGFEQEALTHFNEANYMCGKYDRLLGRLLQGYLFGNYLAAINESLAEDLSQTDLDEGIFHEAVYTIFNILCLIALKQNAYNLEPRLLLWLDQAKKKVIQWEHLNPSTFSAPSFLIQAEQAALEASSAKVIYLYESAIETAEQNSLPLFQALANERLGLYRFKKGQASLGLAFLEESIRLYASWGAQAKTSELRQFIKEKCQTDTIATGINIDWQTLITASQQLSRPLNLHNLKEQVLSRVSQVTGAQIASLYEITDGQHWQCTLQSNEGKLITPQLKAAIQPTTVINYCANTREKLLLKNACQEGDYILDEYISEHGCKSLLGLPLVFDDQIIGVMTLEHRETANLFTAHHENVVDLLVSQYLISQNNSLLYSTLQEQNLQLENQVSERTQALKQKTNQLEAILDALPLPYVLTRMDGKLIATNERFNQLFKLEQRPEIGNVLDLYVSSIDRQYILEGLRESSTISNFECQLKSQDGIPFWAQFSSTLLQLENEKAIFSVISDISERKEREEKLYQQASTDPLTGALNRRAFIKYSTELTRFNRPQGTILAMLDLDHFKQLNDTYGHSAGDEVLKGFTELVKHQLRENDLFGRIGGEEFALILSNIQADQAYKTLERIRSKLEESLFTYKRDKLSVTVSIGATSWRSTSTIDIALDVADKALYQAKNKGRNCTVMSD